MPTYSSLFAGTWASPIHPVFPHDQTKLPYCPPPSSYARPQRPRTRICGISKHAGWGFRQLLYSVDSVRPSASSSSDPQAGVTSVGFVGNAPKTSEAHRRPKLRSQLNPSLLTGAGPLRLLEAARLSLERFGDPEEAMSLAESAWSLMFG